MDYLSSAQEMPFGSRVRQHSTFGLAEGRVAPEQGLLCKGELQPPGTAQPLAQTRPAPGRTHGQPWGSAGSAAAPEQLRPQANIELDSCFTPQSLQLLYFPLPMTTKYWRKPRTPPEHWKARTGNLMVHQVLGAAPHPYARGTGRNLPWAKGIPESSSVYLWNIWFQNIRIKIQNVLPFSYTLLGTFKTHVRIVFKQVAAKHYHDSGPQTSIGPRHVKSGKEGHNLTKYPKALCPHSPSFQPIHSREPTLIRGKGRAWL